MENARNSTAIDAIDPRFLAARDARMAYEDAVSSDGVSVGAWASLAGRMHAAVEGLRSAGALAGVIESLRARAVDAEQRAHYAARMLAVARSVRPIDMNTIAAIDICPGCHKPGHASETDDDGFHPHCVLRTAAA